MCSFLYTCTIAAGLKSKNIMKWTQKLLDFNFIIRETINDVFFKNAIYHLKYRKKSDLCFLDKIVVFYKASINLTRTKQF